VRAVAEEIGPGHGFRMVQLDFLGDGSEILVTDALRIEILDGEKLVGASTLPGRLQFRAAARRTLQVSASWMRDGGASPLDGVEARIADQVARTPRTTALPRARAVVIDAPETVTLPNGERAVFAGWVGSSHKLADWS